MYVCVISASCTGTYENRGSPPIIPSISVIMAKEVGSSYFQNITVVAWHYTSSLPRLRVARVGFWHRQPRTCGAHRTVRNLTCHIGHTVAAGSLLRYDFSTCLRRATF